MARVCTAEGCDDRARARGWCNKHYLRLRRFGDPLHRRILEKTKPCTLHGCGRLRVGRGLCERHLLRLRKYGSPYVCKTRYWTPAEDAKLREVMASTNGGRAPYGTWTALAREFGRTQMAVYARLYQIRRYGRGGAPPKEAGR